MVAGGMSILQNTCIIKGFNDIETPASRNKLTCLINIQAKHGTSCLREFLWISPHKEFPRLLYLVEILKDLIHVY